MHYFRASISIASLVCTTLLGIDAQGQSAAQQPLGAQPGAPAASTVTTPAPPNVGATTPAAGQAPTSAPVPAAVAAPAAPPQSYAVPPGYMLVPIGGNTEAELASVERQRELAEEREEEMQSSWEPGDPVPEGYRVVRRSRRGLVIAGSIVGGIAYSSSVVAAVAIAEDDSAPLLIPVVGPWIMLATGSVKDRACSDAELRDYMDPERCGDRSGTRAALALDGLMQVAGATMLTIGLAYPSTRLVRNNFRLSMAPIPFGHTGYGLGAIGTF